MTSEFNRRKCDLNRFQQSCIALDNEKLRKALDDSEAEVERLKCLLESRANVAISMLYQSENSDSYSLKICCILIDSESNDEQELKSIAEGYVSEKRPDFIGKKVVAYEITKGICAIHSNLKSDEGKL